MSSYEHPTAPRGFVYQIVILSTWGDQYYVGLNGVQMYDIQGRMILLKSNSKATYLLARQEGIGMFMQTPCTNVLFSKF